MVLPSPPFNALFHAIGCWAVAVNLTGLYMVMRHTPSVMRHLRIYLAGQIAVNTLFDVYFAFLMNATPFFPYMAGYTYGPLWTVLGIRSIYQLAFMIFIIFVYITAITQVFYAKAISMMTNEPSMAGNWLHRVDPIAFWIVVHVAFSLPSCVLMILSASPRQETLDSAAESLPPSDIALLEIDSFDFIVTGSHNNYIVAIAALLFAELGLHISLTIYCILLIFRLIQTSRQHITATAYKQARSFATILVLQAIAPIVCVASPVFVVLLSVLLRRALLPPSGWRLLFCVIELHGTLGTTLLIVLLPPYRRVLLRWARKARATLYCGTPSSSPIMPVTNTRSKEDDANKTSPNLRLENAGDISCSSCRYKAGGRTNVSTVIANVATHRTNN